MPEYLSPGVYVEEIDLGSKPIEGVSTSTTGLLGIARRGPVNYPVLITNFGEYDRSFGSFLPADPYKDNRWLPFAVDGFFANGGKRAYILRVGPIVSDINQNPTNVAHAILPSRGGSRRSLLEPARAGDTEVELDSWAGVKIVPVADVLQIDDGQAAEVVRVTGFGRGVQVSPSLQANHVAGTAVSKMTIGSGTTLARPSPNSMRALNIRVEDAARLKTTSDYFISDDRRTEVIRPGTGAGTANETYVELAPANAKLATTHPAGATLHEVKLDTSGSITIHTTGAVATERKINLSSTAGLSPGMWVQVEGASASENEFVQLSGPFPTTGPPFAVDLIFPEGSGGGLQFAHGTTKKVQPATPDSEVATRLIAPARVRLTASASLKANNVVVLDTGLSSEVGRLVADAPTSGDIDVDFYAPLRLAHAATAAVVPVTAPSEKTRLNGAVAPGVTRILLDPVTGILPGSILELSDGLRTEYVEVKSFDGITNTADLMGNLRFPHADNTPVFLLEGALKVIAGPNDPDPKLFPEVGAWGNQIRIQVQSVPTRRAVIRQPAATTDSVLVLSSTQGIEEGSLLRLPGNQYVVVSGVTGDQVTLTKPPSVAITAADIDPAQLDLSKKQVVSYEFSLRFTYGLIDEFHRNLSMHPGHSRYFVTVINRDSMLVHIEDLSTSSSLPADAEAAVLRQPLSTAEWYPAGGDDLLGSITPNTFIGQDAADAEERTGLFALNNRTDLSIVAIPGQTDPAIQSALITHVERARYRIAVLDPREDARLDHVRDQKNNLPDSKYAALYYPWIQIFDPTTDPTARQPVFAPPSGYVCGVYAGTDAAVGVHKAPANVVVGQALGLKFTITQGQQDVLNPENINVIRAFPGRGIRVWGARTISSDPAWRYVNVRRLFIFLEHSIDDATQYAVFEPNDVPLWERLRGSVTAFLTTQWRAGMLQGRTPQEAFFVKVGLGETMTQDDIDNGRVIMLIGVAPVKPAEFVIFRITQMPRGSAVTA